MAKRSNPIKALKVKIINIVLYPEEAQKTENYIEYFKKIFEDKITVNTYGDRYTRVQTYYTTDDGNVIYGAFANAAFFDPEAPALDSDTNEVVPSGADPKKGLGLKTWEYYFFPEYHRLVFLDKETSGSQILDFLNSALNRFLDKDDYQVNTEKDRELIDRIIKSTSLSKLKVVVSYSNNDNNKGWKKLIDDQLKRSRPKKAVLDLSGSKKIPIDVTRSEMITGFVELSASNGYVEASEIDLIEYVASTILSVGPNMLGFTLSGYALMMGLSNSEFVRGLINFKEEGKDYSLFQSLNTIFAVVLGMMFLTTIVGAFACIVVKAEISLPEAWSSFINAYNWVCLFVLMFLMYYTINAIKDVVINIFNFGQYVQVYAEKTEDDEINEKGFE